MKKKKILFAGHSDDVVNVVDQATKPTDDYAVDCDKSPVAIFSITDETGAGVLVYAHYGANACWYFALGRVLEGAPLPPWRVAIGTDDKNWNGYTSVFIIEVPIRAKVTRMTA
jgi:hypothetical protein